MTTKTLIVNILVVALAIPAWTVGCYKRVEIPREQLTDNSKLNSKGASYFVETSGPEKSPPFKTLTLSNGILSGEFKDSWQKGQSSYPLADVKRIELRERNVPMTTLAIVLGFAALLGAVWLGTGLTAPIDN